MTAFRTAIVSFLLAAAFGPASTAHANSAAERTEMVRILQLEALMVSRETGIPEIDPRVLDAMRAVPRHVFVPPELRDYAYRNHALPVGHEQNIAAPLLVALMTHLIEPEPDDVVFETGTGAGYHAAVLSRLVAEVYSVEVVEPLAERAGQMVEDLELDNVFTRAGDGYYGWPGKRFDGMIVKEAIDHVPQPLINQLKPGGRLVIPLGPPGGPQYLTVVTRDDEGRTSQRRVLPVRFSPLQGGQRL